MVNTEDYIIPCERVFDEKLTDDLVENKEKLASDFLKKMRVGFDMKMLGDTPQSLMTLKMEGTLFKNEFVALPIDNNNRSLGDLFEKASLHFSSDLLAKEIVSKTGINRFDDKYPLDYDSAKKECNLVRIRLEGIVAQFTRLEKSVKGKALGSVFIKEADKNNPLFTNKSVSFDLLIKPNTSDNDMIKIQKLFETEMQKIGFKRDEAMEEKFDNGVEGSFHVSSPTRKFYNAVSLRKGYEEIKGDYEVFYARNNDTCINCFWDLKCKVKGESLTALNKVMEKLPKHEITHNFEQFESIESLAYNQLKKRGYKDYMYSPNFKYNGKKIRNTKGLTEREVDAIDLIEKWAKENNIRNSKGYVLSYYASTERPKYAFTALLKEAKSKGFSFEKANRGMQR